MLIRTRSLTLALPYVFGAIGENTLHVFGAVNLISIPIGKSTTFLVFFRASRYTFLTSYSVGILSRVQSTYA